MKVHFISGPERNVRPGYWLHDYLIRDGYTIIPYFHRHDDKEKITVLKRYVRLLSIIIRILLSARQEDMILVYDHDFTGVYLSFFISIFRPSLKVLKINCMGGNKKQLMSRLMTKAAKIGYRKMYTTCNNENIGKLFSKYLNIPLDHFISIPDSISDFGEDISKIKDIDDKGYIFMGGATHRDYRTFVECAQRLPQYRFVAVTFLRFKPFFENSPSNVKVVYGLPEKEFYYVIAHSSVVFVPLLNDLQGGQMVLFQGALLKKALVTTYNEAITTYFDEKSIFLLKIGDVENAVLKLDFLMKSKEERQTRGLKAFEQINEFSTEKIYQQYKVNLFQLANASK